MRIISEPPGSGSGDVTRQSPSCNPLFISLAGQRPPAEADFLRKSAISHRRKNFRKFDENSFRSYVEEMNLWVIRTIAVATVFFASVLRLDAAKPARKATEDVQALANFPALQRLAAKSEGKVIREFLREVSSEYRAAGYGAFAQALPEADSLIALFGEPETAEDAGALKQARATLRHLQSALAKNPRIALPTNIGEKIPDYFGIATAFNQNASRALKNLAAGKNVANFLRKTPSLSWVTKIDETHFGLGGTSAASVTLTTTSGLVNIDAGAVLVIGSNGSTGGTVIASGTLRIENLSSSLGAVTLRPGASIQLGSIEGYRWVAFAPEIEIPSEWSELPKITFSSAFTTGSVTFASGTRVVKSPLEFPLPADAAEIPANTPLTLPVDYLAGGNFTGGTLVIATPTPSPTPAE